MSIVTDDMARAFVRKYREFYPGDGWPALDDARALVSAAMLYARPVEEPGEVERLKRERDAARQEAKEWQDAAHLSACEAHSGQLEEAEAALAETRESLEKVEAEARELRDPRVIQEIMSALALRSKQTKATRDEPHTRNVQAIVEKLARAALTGDAQEAGR